METYTAMRHFADSWGLVFMFAVFVGVVLWAFRPGSRATHEDIANIPFRHEDKPAAPPEAETEETAR
jgi:cytochrome c oxidase cbb3-type subunit 4